MQCLHIIRIWMVICGTSNTHSSVHEGVLFISFVSYKNAHVNKEEFPLYVFYHMEAGHDNRKETTQEQKEHLVREQEEREREVRYRVQHDPDVPKVQPLVTLSGTASNWWTHPIGPSNNSLIPHLRSPLVQRRWMLPEGS